uniref:Uncharacterized protein n=1 Tax=Arundo donax TaxID=35708 RepID=A0A0A9DUE6_ARUDO
MFALVISSSNYGHRFYYATKKNARFHRSSLMDMNLISEGTANLRT